LRALARGSWLALVGVLTACVELPRVGNGECGNGVIEPPEDCDGFGVDGGAVCLPKGAVGECHLSCSRLADGASGCPAGWGCDASGICRRPTGGFEPPRELDVGTATALASADFDGDGHDDVLSAERPNPFGVTRLKVHYFDDQGAPSETRQFSHLLVAPSRADMNGDGRADLLFTDGNVGMLLGRADRSMVPETFSSYRIPNTTVRNSAVFDQEVQDTTGFVVLAELDAVSGLYVPDIANGGQPRRLAALSSPIDALVADPENGDLIEGDGSPCREVVVAFAGESQLTVIDVCTRGGDGAVVWRPEALSQVVALDPPEPIAFAPQLIDMNADGHLDVLIGSSERAFVAYGDGVVLAPAVPLRLVPANGEPVDVVPMPLAAGDVTGDGVVDFVFPEGLVLTSPSATTPGQTEYVDTPLGLQGPFSAAVIADVNANGFPDIVAASSGYPGLTFFNGTGTRDVTFFAIPTNRPAERLAVGDFDGDLVQDVALTQSDPEDGTDEALIAFGVPFGPPLPPVAVARLDSIDQLEPYHQEKISHLILATNAGSGPDREAALTLLVGSGDRVPLALYELTTFAADSSVNGASAARAIGGAFIGTTPGDVLALGYRELPSNEGLEFWLLPELTSSAGSPARLVSTWPSDAHPVLGELEGLSLGFAAADIDGDARDEALLATPVTDDEHCGLHVLRIERDRVELLSQIVVPDPCALIELSPVQADGDGRLDVAWLSARADGGDRRVSIFWNDGAGGFSSDRRLLLNEPSAAPQAFTLLPAGPARGPSMMIATPSGLELRSLESRELGASVPVFDVSGVTGVTAGDLNGDGTLDIAAAVRGNLIVLGAALESL
jgi:hypothetical protein